MAQPRTPDPALLVVALFSRHPGALAWGCERLELLFGKGGFQSLPYAFSQTGYYERTMGGSLQKTFLAFHHLVASDCLPEAKLRTNALEEELAASGRYPEPRPLNLDPGILTLGKFMLATTKDQAHRILVGQGIFAEVTLRFEKGSFEPWPWTYADYRQECVRNFLRDARDYYRQQRKGLHNKQD